MLTTENGPKCVWVGDGKNPGGFWKTYDSITNSSDALVMPLRTDNLSALGLWNPKKTRKGNDGLFRFVVPLLGLKFKRKTDCPLVMFVESGMTFEHGKIDGLFRGCLLDRTKAAWCRLTPKSKHLTDLMMFDLDHPSNLKLTVDDVNSKPAAWLHGLSWLEPTEIGYITEETLLCQNKA